MTNPDGAGKSIERRQVVRSIYDDVPSFLVGITAIIAAATTTAVRTQDAAVWTITVAIAVVSLVRLSTILAFRRVSADGADFSVDFWERLYAVCGSVHVFCVGLWPAIIFWHLQDAYAQLLSISALLCFLVGVQGRNFASPTIIRSQIIASAVPIFVTLLSNRDVWQLLLGVFFGAFLLSVVTTSRRMCRMFLGAVRTARQNEVLAQYDALTGLPNRAAMQRMLTDETARLGATFALHFIDLDRFKRINDTLGHPAGDELLRETGRRLQRLARGRATVARYGGDEFVVLQPVSGSAEEARGAAGALARGIVAALVAPFQINGLTLQGGCSVGTAVFPSDGASVRDMTRAADTALYRAKSAGRGRSAMFASEMGDREARRLQIETALRRALDKRQLTLVFQPIIESKSFTIGGCEALVRWCDEELGSISPVDFLPIAEEAGLMNEVTEQTIQMACRAAAGWPEGVGVAVNLSPSQLHRPDIVEKIILIARQESFDPTRLEIEITENIGLVHDEAILAKLWALKSHGIRLSLDDFGTGYSNLGHISRLPLDTIKVDKIFLSDNTDKERQISLLRGAVRLIGMLDLDVVVEGVETEEQLALVVAETSVTKLQGFIFGIPLPDPAIKSLLQSVRREPIHSLEGLKCSVERTAGNLTVVGGA